MLGVFFVLELASLAFGTGGTTTRAAFTGTRTFPQLLSNLGLVQIFGLHSTATWNGPAWSIAAEVWAYLLAAAAIHFAPRRFMWVLVCTIVLSLFTMSIIGKTYLDLTYSWALVRCLYGFCIGMMTFGIYQNCYLEGLTSKAIWTLAEAGIFVACVVSISRQGIGPGQFILPPLFGLAVLIMSEEKGVLAKGLSARPFVFLGTISYSIYMVHMFVVFRFVDILTVVGRHMHIALTTVSSVNGQVDKVVVGPGPVPDLIAIISSLCRSSQGGLPTAGSKSPFDASRVRWPRPSGIVRPDEASRWRRPSE